MSPKFEMILLVLHPPANLSLSKPKCIGLLEACGREACFPPQTPDLIHSALSCKQAKLRLGPIVSYLLTVWRAAGKSLKPAQKWHLNTPIFNNYSLLTGKAPFTFPAWRDRGIHVLGDVFDENGLRSFDEPT